MEGMLPHSEVKYKPLGVNNALNGLYLGQLMAYLGVCTSLTMMPAPQARVEAMDWAEKNEYSRTYAS